MERIKWMTYMAAFAALIVSGCVPMTTSSSDDVLSGACSARGDSRPCSTASGCSGIQLCEMGGSSTELHWSLCTGPSGACTASTDAGTTVVDSGTSVDAGTDADTGTMADAGAGAMMDSDGDGYTTLIDCNDANAAIHPGATEVCGNGVDEDCSGSDLVCTGTDADADGYDSSVDCDDSDPAIHPGATEVCGNGVDEDCSGSDLVCPCDPTLVRTCTNACGVPGATGFLVNSCDSSSACVSDLTDPTGGCTTVTPSDCPCVGLECSVIVACITPCDYVGVQTWQDYCLGDACYPVFPESCMPMTTYVDADGDGHTTLIDCNDANAAIHPGATEVCGNGVDEDCSGSDLVCTTVDADGDGYTATIDCNDANAAIHPGATEVCGNGVDEDCSGSDLVCPVTDADGDGYTTAVDCNDANAAIHPGATEVCGNGVDEDCSGSDLMCTGVDADGDGYTTAVDCNDANAAIHPGATEVCGNGVDEDCSGSDLVCTTVDADGDGYTATIDCNDANAAIHPGATEVCGNGVDEDCSGSDLVCSTSNLTIELDSGVTWCASGTPEIWNWDNTGWTPADTERFGPSVLTVPISSTGVILNGSPLNNTVVCRYGSGRYDWTVSPVMTAAPINGLASSVGIRRVLMDGIDVTPYVRICWDANNPSRDPVYHRFQIMAQTAPWSGCWPGTSG